MPITSGYVVTAYGYINGAPIAGNNEIQTLTANPAVGSLTSGTFQLSFGGELTAAIPYNPTTAQLETAINNLKSVAAGGTASVGVAVTGGQFPTTALSVTFSGTDVRQVVGTPLLVLAYNNMGGGGSITIARTQTAVSATFRGAPPGAVIVDTTNDAAYSNTGTAASPTWTAA
jgi:hypothetical protein